MFTFWYRESPIPMEPLSFAGAEGQLSSDDPPALVEGMSSVITDLRGRWWFKRELDD